MITSDKQSHDFSIPLSHLFEDDGVLKSQPVTLHKFKTLKVQNVIALRPKVHDLNVSPVALLKIKK